VEYILRHKRGLAPQPPPLRLGKDALDRISLPEPDLSIYDQLTPEAMTRDPGSPPKDDPPGGSSAWKTTTTSSTCSFTNSARSSCPEWSSRCARCSRSPPRTTSPRSTSSTASATRRS